MAKIEKEQVIASVANALQYISYYHPKDFVDSMYEAYQLEESSAAKDCLAQLLINSKLCAANKRPLCQDTGLVTVFIKVGMDAEWEDSSVSIEDMINEGVRRAYQDSSNPLRKSVVADPSGDRLNTKDNTPAVIHTEVVPGNEVEITVAAKGGGSENKAKFAVLNPSDSVVDWVLETVPKLGAGWCPPGILGIGIGGTPEKAMLMAKESLMDPINISELKENGAKDRIGEMRLELYEKINKLGIGAQGVGGVTTVFDVKIKDYPTHAASLPVAMIPNCAATRHIHFKINGSGEVVFADRDQAEWPQIDYSTDSIKKVNINDITKDEIASWNAGDVLLLSGKILTGRDAAHKRIFDILSSGEPLPEGLDFNNRFIYYVGPVDPVGEEIVGPAGPTTSTRMDKFTEFMLSNTGLLGMIGKAERGDQTIQSIKQHRSVYLMAVGGAALLISQSIKSSRVVAFEDLGMEAVYEFEVEDMPVTVGVSSAGDSIHKIGPDKWKR